MPSFILLSVASLKVVFVKLWASREGGKKVFDIKELEIELGRQDMYINLMQSNSWPYIRMPVL